MRIPSRIPGNLSIRGGPPILPSGGPAYNYALGGLPWLSAASPSLGNYYYGDRRIRRATAPIRKDQFDNQPNPGEQSLAGYWIRSQMSFHGGAGQLYSDPSQDNPQSEIRFWRSMNVDPWTRGRLGLLHSSIAVGKANVLELFSVIVGDGTGCVIGIQQNAVFLVEYNGTVHNKTTPSVANIRSVTSNGNAIFVSSTDGVWKATMPATPGAALSWTQIYTIGGGGATRQEIAWVKDRLVLGINRDLYELSANPAGPPAALPTPFYTATSQGWTWTSIHETSPAIYAVGSVNGVGSIFKFTLDSSGGLPTLTGGTVAATLPGGEVPYAVYGYLGNLLGIGTSRGARVAQSDDQGFLTYGPLIFESASPVVDWIGRDRFLYCTYADKLPDETLMSDDVEPTIKLARIDLSLQIEPLRFAYASDMVANGDNGACSCVTLFGGTDQLAFATPSELYREQEFEDEYATTGYLTTSRIRFSTLEPKNFRNFRVRGPVLEGTLGVSVIDNTGAETPIINFGVGQTPGTSDVTIPNGPLQDYLALKFVLQSSGDPGDPGAVMTGWQMKALPGSPRQRLITLPLWCFDRESDKHGQVVGGTYTALSRLLAMESVEAAGALTVFQDFDADVTYDVFLEELEFVQVDPPPSFKGWGGILWVTMRTV